MTVPKYSSVQKPWPASNIAIVRLLATHSEWSGVKNWGIDTRNLKKKEKDEWFNLFRDVVFFWVGWRVLLTISSGLRFPTHFNQ